MSISKEDDRSPWEQYHIILLSHISMYWIWSMLDPDERLLVNGVSPLIFGSQHCFRFQEWKISLRVDTHKGIKDQKTCYPTTFRSKRVTKPKPKLPQHNLQTLFFVFSTALTFAHSFDHNSLHRTPNALILFLLDHWASCSFLFKNAHVAASTVFL